MEDEPKVSNASVVIYQAGDGNKYAYNPFSQTGNQQPPENGNKTLETLKSPNGICNYYCQYCSLSFIDTIEYEHHNTEMHGQKKLLTCHICTATFRRQDHLKRHMRSLHLNQKFCMCPVCGKDCKRQDILLKHIKKKHTATTDIFHCRECQFTCSSHSELEKHEFTHLSTERHLCPHCQSTFKRRDHMLRHVKSQHLNQAIACPICNQSYKRKDHVVRHVREKHRMGFLNGKLVTASDMV